MPLPLLGSYARSIGAVRAAERLHAISDSRVGALPVKRSTARDHVRRLERAASSQQPRRPANLNRLRAAGIGVEFVKAGER